MVYFGAFSSVLILAKIWGNPAKASYDFYTLTVRRGDHINMVKLKPITENSKTVGYFFDCPGCKIGHAPYVHPYQAPNGASWSFNGDLDKPTFSPSLLTKIEFTNGKVLICHSFVTAGKIQFLSDCTHELAGQTVEIPERD